MTYKFPDVDGINAVWEIDRNSVGSVIVRLYDDPHNDKTRLKMLAIHNTGVSYPSDDKIRDSVMHCIAYHQRRTAALNGFYRPGDVLERGEVVG